MAEGSSGPGPEGLGPPKADIIVTKLQKDTRRGFFDKFTKPFRRSDSSQKEINRDVKPEVPQEPPWDLQSYTPDELKNHIKRRQFLARLAIFGGIAGLVVVKGPDILLKSPVWSDPSSEWQKLEKGEPIQVKGNEVRLNGVAHFVENFESYKAEITEQIRNSPFVFLEYFNDTIRPNALLTTTEAQLKSDGTFEDSMNKFYAAIGKICAEEGKDVIVVNPDDTYARDITAFLTGGLAAGTSVDRLLDLAKSKFGEPMPRRKLLGGIAKIAGLSEVAILSGINRKIQRIPALQDTLMKLGIITQDLPNEDKANLLAWSVFDWRDINSSKGMQKAMELYKDEIKPGEVAPAFNGGAHRGMTEYLKNPSLGEAKNILYAHFNAVGETSVRRFSYNKEQNKWNLKQASSY